MHNNTSLNHTSPSHRATVRINTLAQPNITYHYLGIQSHYRTILDRTTHYPCITTLHQAIPHLDKTSTLQCSTLHLQDRTPHITSLYRTLRIRNNTSQYLSFQYINIKLYLTLHYQAITTYSYILYYTGISTKPQYNL